MSDSSEDKALWPPVEPVSAGLRGRCPRCDQGRMFAGFLSLAPQCGVCGLDYSFADAGDGPAVFVILVVGALVSLVGLWMRFTFSPPAWVFVAVLGPLVLILGAWALRAFKGVLIALQFRNKAEQGQLDRP
jgi:uncharacterized protein (DUF983 family)